MTHQRYQQKVKHSVSSLSSKKVLQGKKMKERKALAGRPSNPRKSQALIAFQLWHFFQYILQVVQGGKKIVRHWISRAQIFDRLKWCICTFVRFFHPHSKLFCPPPPPPPFPCNIIDVNCFFDIFSLAIIITSLGRTNLWMKLRPSQAAPKVGNSEVCPQSSCMKLKPNVKLHFWPPLQVAHSHSTLCFAQCVQKYLCLKLRT